MPELKEIRLVAGEEGIHRPVAGVNVTESYDLTDFFRENELIITTGINMADDPEKWLSMVEAAYRCNASGIILNVGPYIRYIPEEILGFGNEHRFPVFSMPWACRVADFVKITVRFLAAQEMQTAKNHLLSDLLFHPNPDVDRIAGALSRLGIRTDSDFCIIVCSINGHRSERASIAMKVESALRRHYRVLLSLAEKDRLVFMTERPDARALVPAFSQIVKDLYEANHSLITREHVTFGQGSFYHGLGRLAASYREALTVVRLAGHHPNHWICEYRQIGAYKLILNVRDRNVLDAYHDETLGALYHYDALHGTDLVKFLRVYLEEDGRTANIARRTFIHRNTVLYKMKKIESILNTDLNLPLVKTNLSIAYMIEDVRNQAE